ncbi:MAG: phosphoenolpyruvate carboxylase, partial [Armatimonadetes bacterium]|nr:phosphoenolpyruvate carboxylase [Armatimonadota bacterium]
MSADTLFSLTPRELSLSEPLSEDILLLDRLLEEVLLEQEGPELLALIRSLCAETDTPDADELARRYPELLDPKRLQRVLRAFTVLFQLLNTAEQKEIVRVNRERQNRLTGEPRPESIGDAIQRLQANGTTPEQIQALLHQIDIRPTLTAHPTEARRRAVQDKLRSIAQGLVAFAHPLEASGMDSPLNSAEVAAGELRRTLTALWQTDELRATSLTVRDEVRNALYFFEHTILDV